MSFTATYSDDEPSREEVDQSSGLLVLEFGANWCGHCQALSPALQELFEQQPTLRHIRVADARGKPLGRSFRVKLWPTVIFLRDGQPIAQLVRPSEEEVADALQLMLQK
jgi:thioredoxin 1